MIRTVYMIGICGVAMGALARMFRERGAAVSGSDRNVYPPMSDLLREGGVALHEGFDAGRIGSPDLVVIGNAVSRGNPEVEHVLNEGLPYLSMAGTLREHFLGGKEVVAVAGTHGKTTTTALLAHILETAGMEPSFFIGGVARNYGSNFRLGPGRHFVIEADEYDSAFFEKFPKFILYRPSHLVLTSLEFDHADIYRDLGEIETWFRRLVNTIPSAGSIVYSARYDNLGALAAASLSQCRSYGNGGADYCATVEGHEGEFTRLVVDSPEGSLVLRCPLIGAFNHDNCLAALAMARRLGVDDGAIMRGVESFLGVKRRQELIYHGGNLRIYEDFAHHPTAIRGLLESMRERHPGARIWALYEPRSATSRRRVFQESLPGSFRAADEILIRRPFEGTPPPAGEELDVDRLMEDLHAVNPGARLFESGMEMAEYLARALPPEGEQVVLVMSNGGFDGIYERLRGAPGMGGTAGQHAGGEKTRAKAGVRS
ncbi:MAG: UDP-N-acetylmuramate:L-alanyl-gamma-D-glutamyl-meso-diaminopimelate ligase [Spirochaetes bacterium]|nr:UDP-N-acetylmuramate:L-alanyl-gamma-D-glutamyl-meso-diaminopimelate ligase [Spirochaetota bacterium]